MLQLNIPYLTLKVLQHLQAKRLLHNVQRQYATMLRPWYISMNTQLQKQLCIRCTLQTAQNLSVDSPKPRTNKSDINETKWESKNNWNKDVWRTETIYNCMQQISQLQLHNSLKCWQCNLHDSMLRQYIPSANISNMRKNFFLIFNSHLGSIQL